MTPTMSSPARVAERYAVLLDLKNTGKWFANRLGRSSKKEKRSS